MLVMAFLEGETGDGKAVELVPLDPENEEHVGVWARIRNEPTVRATAPYGSPTPPSRAREEIEARHEAGKTVCAMRADDTVVGWGGVSIHDDRARVAKPGGHVLPEYQGNGYGTALLRLVTAYAFDELNAKVVRGETQANNDVALHIFEELGFTREGVKRNTVYKQGEYWDMTVWSMLESEYEEGALGR